MVKTLVCLTLLVTLACVQCYLPFLGEEEGKPLRFHAIGDHGFYPVFGNQPSGEVLYEQNSMDKENPFDVPNAVVADKMEEVANKSPIDFVLGLGDNFYMIPNGLEHIDDPRVDYMFNHTYNKPSLKVPFYMVLGNHDCYGKPQLEVQQTDRHDQWNMPSNYYEQTFNLDNGKKALFLFLDGCIMSCADHVKGGNSCDDFSYSITEDIVNTHLAWLVNTLEKYASDDTIAWRAIAVHWPFFSIGHSHGDSDSLKNNVMPLVAKYGIDVIISGHDHNSQYINMNIETYNQKGVTPGVKSRDDCTIMPIGIEGSKDLHYNQGEHVHQFVAGNSGVPPNFICKSRETPDENLIYAAWVNGFIEVEVSSESFIVRNWAIYTSEFLSQVTIHAKDSTPSQEFESMNYRAD